MSDLVTDLSTELEAQLLRDSLSEGDSSDSPRLSDTYEEGRSRGVFSIRLIVLELPRAVL